MDKIEVIMTTMASLTILGGIAMIPLEWLRRRRNKKLLADISKMLTRHQARLESMNKHLEGL